MEMTRSYASDCTGIDAPMLALKELAAVAASNGVGMWFRHLWASELEDNKNAIYFLGNNHHVEKLFSSCVRTGPKHEGALIPNKTTGNIADCPCPDVYVCGSECVDYTPANYNRDPVRLEWDHLHEKDAGATEKTLLASIATVKLKRPRFVLLETSGFAKATDITDFINKELKEYKVLAIRSNCADFEEPTERDRLYFVIILWIALLPNGLNLEDWPSMLEEFREPRGVSSCCERLLAHDHSSVDAEYNRLSTRLRAVPASRKIAREWEGQHEVVRSKLGLPKVDMAAQLAPDKNGGVFPPMYNPRERELVGFVKAELERRLDLKCGDYFINIAVPTDHNRLWYPGVIPPLLKNSYIGWFRLATTSCGRKAVFVRHVLGVEHLRLLGFSCFDRTGVTDCGLRELAGNSMSCLFLSKLFILGLCSVDFQTPLAVFHKQLDGGSKGVLGTRIACLGVSTLYAKIAAHPQTSYSALHKVALPGLGTRHHMSDFLAWLNDTLM